MAAPSTTYEARSPGASALYQVVRDHLDAFRAEAGRLRDGAGLPRFVEQAFRDFLTCGCLAGGFARFHCDCGLDRLVAFSCKGRGFCLSCGGRRMAERAAHLVDHVFPDVPVRQWVLSLPYRLRYRLAWDHDLCRAVVRAFVHAVLGWLRRRARRAGVADGRGGAVVVIQRFGGSLNLNVHLHGLMLDGVFARDADGALTFHHARALTALDVDEVLATVEARVGALLDRREVGVGHGEGAESDAWADDQPVPAGLAAAAVAGTVALGPSRGARVGRRGGASEAPDPPGADACHARANGFDLHAGLGVPAGHRARLARVCRYVLRPPVAAERVQRTAEGQVRLAFRRPWRDGTTALVFEPVEFLGRLAVLVPRPRINLVLYHGVLAPRAAWRAAVVVRPRRSTGGDGVPAGPRPVLGVAHGADVRVGRLGVSPVRGTAPADCPHRRGGCDRPDAAASRPADRSAHAASSPCAAARVGRGRPRARADGRGRWPPRAAPRCVSHRPAGACPRWDGPAEVCPASPRPALVVDRPPREGPHRSVTGPIRARDGPIRAVETGTASGNGHSVNCPPR